MCRDIKLLFKLHGHFQRLTPNVSTYLLVGEPQDITDRPDPCLTMALRSDGAGQGPLDASPV